MSKKLEELQKEKEEALLQRDHEWQEKMAGKVSYTYHYELDPNSDSERTTHFPGHKFYNYLASVEQCVRILYDWQEHRK